MIISLLLLFIFTLLGIHYGQIAEPNMVAWGQSLPEGVMGKGLFYELEMLMYAILLLNLFGAIVLAWAQERGRKLRTFLGVAAMLAVFLLVGYYTQYQHTMITFVMWNPVVLLLWAAVLAFRRLNGYQTSKTAYTSKSNWK